MNHLKEDLTGKRFGRLRVISRAPNKNGKPMWNCVCDCGTECVKAGGALRGGYTNSCGCYRKEYSRLQHTKHSGSARKQRDRLYSVWNMMKQRCNDPNNKSYKNYGGRGISVCEEWASDYQAFRAWSLQNGYDPDAPSFLCTIDRIDNDKGYSPENCRFVDSKTQAFNRRNTVFATIGGITKPAVEWAEINGINVNTLRLRLRSGWPPDLAVSIRPQIGRNQTWRKYI